MHLSHAAVKNFCNDGLSGCDLGKSEQLVEQIVVEDGLASTRGFHVVDQVCSGVAIPAAVTVSNSFDDRCQSLSLSRLSSRVIDRQDFLHEVKQSC